MKRLLFVCHRWPYPPNRGGKIRPFNIISHLSQTYRVTVASLVRSEEEERNGEELSKYCDQVLIGRVSSWSSNLHMLANLPRSVPSSMGYFWSSELQKQIDAELQSNEYSMIFVHCSSVAQYVANVDRIPKILDFGDMDSQKWLAYSKFKPFPLSLGYFVEGAKLEREEKRLAKLFDYCTCTTRLEHKTLQSFNVAKRTAWFPNGVDSEYFSPSDMTTSNTAISFIGRMDYYPNQQAMIEFCRAVLPEIRRQIPSVTLDIIGANPSKEIEALQRQPGVNVTGWVDDVRPYVRRSSVNVAPLQIARGTQNKILEAMAMGLPVVTTNIAAAGVDARPGIDLLVADSPSEQVETIVNLLRDDNMRRTVGMAARQRVLNNHAWKHAMERMEGEVLAEMQAYADSPASESGQQ